ncbi:unnamed protein product [Echinostoma caproni]|uniref:Reverse transcriptase domain-containing protein n=1 Tax=Echinostoma caproni TaxID=27848 RepID=A0A183AFE5_9TREM|nr:unnamed protein product [Echinostoma caproni]
MLHLFLTSKLQGSVYKRINPATEIPKSVNQRNFWQQQQQSGPNVTAPPKAKKPLGWVKPVCTAVDNGDSIQARSRALKEARQAEVASVIQSRLKSRASFEQTNGDSSSSYKKIDPRADIMLARQLSKTSCDDEQNEPVVTSQIKRQIDGVAMGSPLGPVLAELFMAHLEEKGTTILWRVILYKRYVDDTVVITEILEEPMIIMDEVNRLHPNIHFTMESESNNKLNFLDITTRREDGAQSVYRKETWAGQYLHFENFMPLEYKRGLVRTLFDRTRLIRKEDRIEQELQNLREFLAKNAYPEAFVTKPSKPRIAKKPIASAPEFRVTLYLQFKGEPRALQTTEGTTWQRLDAKAEIMAAKRAPIKGWQPDPSIKVGTNYERPDFQSEIRAARANRTNHTGPVETSSNHVSPNVLSDD